MLEQMNCDRLAALLTCHNRKPKTLACLEALFNQELPREVTIDVYLVDDGSTDGTGEAVAQSYPQVKILQGNGSLFWNGGMGVAFAEALKSDYDVYLWLNDDTILYPNALSNLLETFHRLQLQGEHRTIIAGSTCDPKTTTLTYGGVVRRSRWRPLRFDLVQPDEDVKRCDTINGNCVLIPRAVVQLVGNLDPAFTHYAGDWDYGLRAQQKGCTVWVAPGYVGTCSQNYQPGGDADSSVHLGEGLKKIGQPKGLPVRQEILHPIEEWKVFAQRYGGLFWPIYWLIPYRRLLWNSLIGTPPKKRVHR
ncbi:MAG TPA: glycosyltransferase family 2 protein [Waterburya sp.]|jgi:GT2 family glycosyltransferase